MHPNQKRARELLAALQKLYDESGPPAFLMQLALTDLRHLADLHGLHFGVIDRNAHNYYLLERK